ncbi:aspartate kinase [Pontibacter harenae]|uniref:aspartate kinase n=1 Tax=Pontibacter harenae TaxID=2894083 RepID=UPI001E2F5E22|nr:aspartate kinase [Pontibacter harenae]MCC9166033.1 aspartate kinase [Pontibacter harenae]
MKVFKFGGASVKDAQAFHNLYKIVKEHSASDQLLLVVSAMGKTTNALEQVLELAYSKSDYRTDLQNSYTYHQEIVQELFPQQSHPVYEELEQLFSKLQHLLQSFLTDVSYDLLYDQVVSFGELFSSTILHHFLQTQGLPNTWVDSRKYIQTDTTWREARVDWVWTERIIKRDLPSLLAQRPIVTQGFLGGTNNGLTTTLGREGSDYSAAIFAHCLDAESMYIWKDVDGLLNADPKHFSDTIRYDQISYQETVEMAYYGASVIHPKTIKPLANKLIPLYVKSFINPAGAGTKICDCTNDKIAPAYIIKENQCLISFGAKDFAFVSERNMGTIFNALSELRIKINLMQNSAISFSICIDLHQEHLQKLIQTLQDLFVIHYNTGLRLYTIKNYETLSTQKAMEGKEVLLEQRTRSTLHFVCK